MSQISLRRVSKGLYRAEHAGRWAEVSQSKPGALWVTMYKGEDGKTMFGEAFASFVKAKAYAVRMIS